ncbi:MAG: hypothetical protein KME54_24060 [Tolypothrix brevis GSE-NOS-MK-07-07A]|nr:hypothetical protein [Tolypothrix brevis GSE-NOS-MK-07-07A]
MLIIAAKSALNHIVAATGAMVKDPPCPVGHTLRFSCAKRCTAIAYNYKSATPMIVITSVHPPAGVHAIVSPLAPRKLCQLPKN